MGPASWFVNAWACVWTVFVSIIFILPTERPTTPQNMNWAIVYLMGVIFFSMVCWWLGANKFYTGPLVETEVANSESNGGGSRSSTEKYDVKDAGAEQVKSS